MGIVIVAFRTVAAMLYVLGFAWCAQENATLPGLPGTGIVTPPGNNSSVRPETRIIGGVIAGEFEFPHHLYIYQTIPPRKFKCGGSILTPYYVLTAASCVAKYIDIHAGWYDLYESERYNREWRYNFDGIFVHKCYNQTSTLGGTGDVRYDIAVIKLREHEPFTFYEYAEGLFRVKSIGIDVENRAKEGTSVTAIGWGRTVAGVGKDVNSFAHKLKKVQLNIISGDECNGTLQTPFLNYESQVCTSPINGSVCDYDDGGPLLCSENNTKYVCGIIPFSNCSSGPRPSVYTRVSYFKDWINNIVKTGRDSSTECDGSLITPTPASSGFSYNSNNIFITLFLIIFISTQYL